MARSDTLNSLERQHHPEDTSCYVMPGLHLRPNGTVRVNPDGESYTSS